MGKRCMDDRTEGGGGDVVAPGGAERVTACCHKREEEAGRPRVIQRDSDQEQSTTETAPKQGKGGLVYGVRLRRGAATNGAGDGCQKLQE